MNQLVVAWGILWHAIRKVLGYFGDLLGDVMVCDDEHRFTEWPEIKKHERWVAEGLINCGECEF